METERIALSQRERDRLKVLHDVQQKHLTQRAAAERLKVSDRQVRRMLLRIGEHGDGALVHGLRGRPSNRKLAARFEQKVLARVGQRYADFGPTLAAEHLAKDGLLGEPGDAAEVDEQSGLLASARTACESRSCMAGAKGLFRGIGDAGQLSVSLAGGTRSRLPVDRADR